MLNESIDVNPNELLAMLAGDEEETDEEEEEQEEGRDIVTSLEGQFAQFAGALDQRNTELKRKRDSEGALAGIATAPAPTATAAAAPAPASVGLMKTVTRIRKLGPDAGPLSLHLDLGSSTTVTTTNPDPKTSRLARESFVSDRVLDESVGQEGVFREIEPAVTGVLQGSSSIILTYGSTGSGKSYTIMGAGDDAGAGLGGAEKEDRGGVLADGDGILARALERLYKQVARGTSGDGGVSGESSGVAVISFRAIEVYNNKLHDLLREGDQARRVHLPIRRGDDGHDVIEGLSVGFPADLPSALECARRARGHAHVNRTRLNDKSSRGHVIFVVGAHGSSCKTAADLRPTDPVMFVCDLAGPERQDRAALTNDAGGGGGDGGDAEKRSVEAKHINTDTTAQFRAWKVVRSGSRSVSYRSRTLTRVLKGLFVRPRGSPRVNGVMVVCVNPAASEYGETNKVLKNTQISSTVLAPLEEGPSIRKRQRTSGRAGAGGGAAAAAAAAGDSAARVVSAAAGRVGKGKGRLKRAEISAHSSGPEGEGEEGLVAQLREEIKRLEDEKAAMKEEHESDLYEAEKRAGEEAEGMIEELENELDAKKLEVRQLKRQLEDKSPLGAGARAAVAQSAMKIRLKRAESARKLERETTREADEEAARIAAERARVEEQLASALAERDDLKAFAERETSRADEAEAKIVRVHRDHSEHRSARRELEGKVERLEGAAAAEAGRAEDLEGKLRAAKDEIARLESDKQEALSAASATAAASAASTAVSVPEDSSAHSSPTSGGGSDNGEDQGFSGRRDGDSTEGSSFEHGGSEQGEDGRAILSVSKIDDFGSGSAGGNGNGNSSLAGVQHQEIEGGEEKAAAEGAPSSALPGHAFDDSDGRKQELGDADDLGAVEIHQPSPSPKVVAKTRRRKRLGQLASSQTTASPARGAANPRRPKHGVDRKPLGNLENGATPARVKGARGGKKNVAVDENQQEAADQEEEEDGGQEDGNPESMAFRGGGGLERRTRAKKQGATKAGEESETQRCREMRKNARLSKPSPDIVVMTEKQAKNVDICKKIVRERRRRRRLILSFQDGGAPAIWFPEDANLAAELGHLQLMKQMKAGFRYSVDAMDRAAKRGHVDVLEFLWQQGQECTTEAIDGAAKEGHLEAVIWLSRNTNTGATKAAMDSAAANGHLSVVEWLHHNRCEGCTVSAMNWAAENGHLSVVKWLHHNRQEGCTTAAFDRSAMNNHVDVVLWLTRYRTEGGTESALQWAVSRGHTKGHECTTNAMDWAAAFGQTEAVRWLSENRTEGCTKDAMDHAAAGGHLDTVKWLHENRREGCTRYALTDAAGNGHMETVRWLHLNRDEGCGRRAMDDAAANGHLEIVRWLHNNRSEGCSREAMERAARNGHLDVVEFLHDIGATCTSTAIHLAQVHGHHEVYHLLNTMYPGKATLMDAFSDPTVVAEQEMVEQDKSLDLVVQREARRRRQSIIFSDVPDVSENRRRGSLPMSFGHNGKPALSRINTFLSLGV
eukprot:g6657.t1